MSVDLVFFDTNILVYANDTRLPDKQTIARTCIKEALIGGTGVVSTQVLAEFQVTMSKKFKQALGSVLLREQISLLLNLKVVPVDRETFLKALQIQERYGLSLWDAQIIASARLCGATKVLSEDMQEKAIYDGVEVVNPFT